MGASILAGLIITVSVADGDRSDNGNGFIRTLQQSPMVTVLPLF